MPELPEVETVRRGLAATFRPGRLPQLQGWRFVRQNLRYPLPIAELRQLQNKYLLSVERRGKYLLLYFGPNKPPAVLQDINPRQLCRVVVHLGMTGILRVLPKLPEPAHKHDHLWARIQTRDQVYYLLYNDIRRFGSWDYQEFSRFENSFAALGPEPVPLEQYCQQAPLTLALSEPGAAYSNAALLGEHLYRVSRKVQRELKPWLLDGKALCGVGNIYCSESLWLARFSPRRPAGELNRKQTESLAGAIQQTITAAIAAGGTTLKDFRSSGGKPGYFQQELRAYGRDGQECPRCCGRIRKFTQAQRVSYFCPECQR